MRDHFFNVSDPQHGRQAKLAVLSFLHGAARVDGEGATLPV
jgi:hypothetical protein